VIDELSLEPALEPRRFLHRRQVSPQLVMLNLENWRTYAPVTAAGLTATSRG
jgi:hypothetical protein